MKPLAIIKHPIIQDPDTYARHMLVVFLAFGQLALVELCPVMEHTLGEAGMGDDLHFQLNLPLVFVQVQDVQLTLLLPMETRMGATVIALGQENFSWGKMIEIAKSFDTVENQNRWEFAGISYLIGMGLRFRVI